MFETEITIINIILVLFILGSVIYMFFYFSNIRKQIDDLSTAIQNRKKIS